MKSKIKILLKWLRNKYVFYFGHNSFKRETGKHNEINFGRNGYFKHCRINIQGKNNKIVFGNYCHMTGMRILVVGDDNYIEFGEKVVVNASPTQPTVINAVGGKKILIGNNALFSNNIEIHTSDYHGIYDKHGDRINHDKNIIIGKNVWIGLGCKILKGSEISDGSIVGAGSLLSGVFSEENIIIAGNPAKIIKHQVFWRHTRENSCVVPSDLKNKWDS